MRDKMIGRDIDWCAHYGRSGKGKDAERRAVKRNDRNNFKRSLRSGKYE